VAALRVVDFVVEAGPEEVEGFIHVLGPDALSTLKEADERRSQQLRSTFWRGPKQELRGDAETRR